MQKKHKYIITFFLIVACAIAFGPIANNDFVGYDDDRLITENSHIQDGIHLNSILWAFTDTHHEYWHPLTWLSLMLDWRLFGANASGHHIVSLLLHIGAVLFLFLFLNKTTKSLWSSAFAAAFFALHPLRVESVAWAAERKDVLSMFFGMATLCAYVFYVEKRRLSTYIICIMLFALSIMSKPMLATLPCVLLLADYWPLGRLKKQFTTASDQSAVGQHTIHDKTQKQNANGSLNEKTILRKRPLATVSNLLLEKMPFFLLSVLLGLVVIGQLHATNRLTSLHEITFWERMINAMVSYVAYLSKTFWPFDLAVFYPYQHSVHPWQITATASLLLIITAAAVYFIKKAPFLAVGWFWYAGTLFPVIGLMQAGYQAMADRYTYLPSIGIAIILAWGVPSLIKSDGLRKRILFPVAIIILVLLSILTWQQCHHWKNDMTLSTHALSVTKDNYMAHNILAASLIREKKINEAMYHYNESIRINPDYHFAYNNRGILYRNLGQYERAIKDFDAAIDLEPHSAIAYTNRGVAYDNLGQFKQAIEDYSMAIRLRPQDAIAYNNRGGVYFKLGRYQAAIEDYGKAIRLNRNFAGAYGNRASAYLIQGNKKMGCSDAQKACSLGNCRTWKIAESKGDCH